MPYSSATATARATRPSRDRWSSTSARRSADCSRSRGHGIARRCRQRPAAATLTPEQEVAARRRSSKTCASGGTSASMAGFKAFRKKYEDAGVLIQIMKFDGINEIHRRGGGLLLQTGEGSGRARHLLRDPPEPDQVAGRHRREAQDDGGLSRPYQHHQPRSFRQSGKLGDGDELTRSTTASISTSATSPRRTTCRPRPSSKSTTTAITHIHIKDRKMNNGLNMPFGEGDSRHQGHPAADARRRSNLPGHYRVRVQGSRRLRRMTEIAKCVGYCKACLL